MGCGPALPGYGYACAVGAARRRRAANASVTARGPMLSGWLVSVPVLCAPGGRRQCTVNGDSGWRPLMTSQRAASCARLWIESSASTYQAARR